MEYTAKFSTDAMSRAKRAYNSLKTEKDWIAEQGEEKWRDARKAWIGQAADGGNDIRHAVDWLAPLMDKLAEVDRDEVRTHHKKPHPTMGNATPTTFAPDQVTAYSIRNRRMDVKWSGPWIFRPLPDEVVVTARMMPSMFESGFDAMGQHAAGSGMTALATFSRRPGQEAGPPSQCWRYALIMNPPPEHVEPLMWGRPPTLLTDENVVMVEKFMEKNSPLGGVG